MKTLSLAGATLALLTAGAAEAVILDLGTLPAGSFSSPLTIGDFVLTPVLGGSEAPAVDTVAALAVLRGTHPTRGSNTILSRIDGARFTLASVDIGLIPGFQTRQSVASATTWYDLEGVATTDLQTITFGTTFTDVRWIDFNMVVGPYFTNIEVTPGIIPEPEAWVMMVAGFGLIGVGLRRSGARLRAPTMPRAA